MFVLCKPVNVKLLQKVHKDTAAKTDKRVENILLFCTQQQTSL